MAMKGSGGGGYGSRPHVEKSVKTGSGSHGTRPGGAASLGQAYGSHVTNKDDTGYRGPKFHSDQSFQPTPFGNQIAANTVCGPGGSRQVTNSGSQGTHGATNPGSPQPKGRGILTNE
jgi:hypothetical protein